MTLVNDDLTIEMHPSAQPVLLLDESRLQQFDPTNQKDLFMMWSVFARAPEAIEHGKRLENMSWRLWNREALCRPSSASSVSRSCPSLSRSSTSSTSQHRNSHTINSTELPRLSSSVESACSMASTAAASDDNDASLRQQRGNRSVNFGSLVHSMKAQPHLAATAANTTTTTTPATTISTTTTTKSPLQPIKEQHESKSRPAATTCPRAVAGESSTSTVATTNTDSFISAAGTSHTSTDLGSSESDHSVVRGFTPGQYSSYTSKTQLAPAPAPILKPSAARQGQTKKKAGMFMLGGSSGEYESSLRDRMSPDSQRASSKKQTSFDDHVTEIHTQSAVANNDVFESDDEDEDDDDDEDDDEEVSESAIDEDDEDAWEDDEEEVQEKAPRQISFQRIDSAANFQALPTRKSQIALDIERVRSTGNLQNVRSSPALRRSRNSTPNGPSMPASPDEEGPLELRAKAARNNSATLAQPITATPAPAEVSNPALSPRTTRRNMLAGELTESFRKQMIWERQQRNVYNTQAPIKRAHTSTDVRKVESSRPCGSAAANLPSKGSWNQFFDGGSAEYHAKGW